MLHHEIPVYREIKRNQGNIHETTPLSNSISYRRRRYGRNLKESREGR